jgi:hypothetical protein
MLRPLARMILMVVVWYAVVKRDEVQTLARKSKQPPKYSRTLNQNNIFPSYGLRFDHLSSLGKFVSLCPDITRADRPAESKATASLTIDRWHR